MNTRNSKGQFIKGARPSPETEFKPGSIPFNKGMKQSEWMSSEAIERTAKTRFKKGQLPHNVQPLGYIRRTPHRRYGRLVGYDWYINIDWTGARHPNYNYRKYLWEVFYDEEAPKGMIFVAKDGNQAKKPVIENIEMITRAEHIRRNSPR